MRLLKNTLMTIKNERMNCRLLKYKYLLRQSDNIGCILLLTPICLIIVSRVLVHDSLFRNVCNVLIFFLLLSYCFICYCDMVRDYRYRNKRKILFKFYSPMGRCQTNVCLSLLIADFIPGYYRVLLLPFIYGVIYFVWSKEIRRAKEHGFEKCGNWQIRYWFGIILMLPLPVYTLHEILCALKLL